MIGPRFSIGIDLGTTNSALAWVPLLGDGAAGVLPVPQWETVDRVAEQATLPSFLYLPEPAVAAQIAAARGVADASAEWIAGRLARRKAGETPGRVVQSAKSWLCHHAADRTAAFLPWGSDELPAEARISPIHASALILGALRDAWNTRFVVSGSEWRFESQAVTVTVPASFDAVAQRLTLDAARAAGFPESTRLLEEPQAAFYCWLERHEVETELWARLPTAAGDHAHVLVVDIGGGTSDFSLFAVRRAEGSAVPLIERLAVSDHILLGGDNIDMALAHLAETRFGGGEGRVGGGQWEHLVARCRDLKETALAADGPPEQVFSVAVPGRGSGLLAGSLSAQVTRAEIDRTVLDGFFPPCAAGDRPRRAQGGLREWGLPFAADTAVTRHLADFLRDRPAVDAVLFNGGSLHPPVLRERLREQIAEWQSGRAPLVLDNPQPELAVARGAARFGEILHRRARLIASGAARALFLAVHRKSVGEGGEGRGPALVCILPHGAAPEQSFEIADLALELRIDRPVRFETWDSGRHARLRAGDVVEWNPTDFHPLPALETVARLKEGASAPADGRVPVALSARLNDLGVLRVACRSTDAAVPQTWPLDFDLRPRGGDVANAAVSEPNAAPQAMEAARAKIRALFAEPAGRRDRLTAARALSSLEKILGVPKGDWNGVLVRSLWPALEICMSSRATSVEHEETWLTLAGWLLRPGFGASGDEARIDALWRLHENGLRFPGKRVELQVHILWRRVAGGLDRQRQEAVLAANAARLHAAKAPPPELVRLAGALERLGIETKADLARRFIATAADLARARGHCAPWLAALGLLLSRTPLYAGPEVVVPPELVREAWDAFGDLDWTDAELVEMPTLFLRAARVVDNRSLDVPDGLRGRIARKLEKSGVPAQRVAKLRGFVALDRSERLGLFGEALPPGLVLGG